MVCVVIASKNERINILEVLVSLNFQNAPHCHEPPYLTDVQHSPLSVQLCPPECFAHHLLTFTCHPGPVPHSTLWGQWSLLYCAILVVFLSPHPDFEMFFTFAGFSFIFLFYSFLFSQSYWGLEKTLNVTGKKEKERKRRKRNTKM